MHTTNFNLPEIIKSANRQISLIDKLLQFYTGKSSSTIVRIDEEDTQKFQHIKEGYVNGLLIMRKLQTNEILPRCREIERLSKEEVKDNRKTFILKVEINQKTKENLNACNKIKELFITQKSLIKHLQSRRMLR